MTNPEILKLAETCRFDRHISKTTNDIYWECDEEDFLKFAKAMYDKGRDDEAELHVDENY
jgi:hypothetical protein